MGLHGRTGDDLQSLGVVIKKVKVCRREGCVGMADIDVSVGMGGEGQCTGVKGASAGATGEMRGCVRVCEYVCGSV